MADVAAIEHALAHAIGHTIGYIYFFVVIGMMMLIGDFKLGICVLLPLLLSVGILYLSKKSQINVRGNHYEKLRGILEEFQSSSAGSEVDVQEEARIIEQGGDDRGIEDRKSVV